MTNPTPAEIARSLSKGAKRACLKMTDTWSLPGKNSFNANGAWALHWSAPVNVKRGALAERKIVAVGRSFRAAYRLTPLGLAVRAELERMDDD